MNFTFQQKLTMSIGFIGAATAAIGALNPIMTKTEVLIATVVCGFVSACLSVVATVVSSQASQVKAVAAMPGVERVTVNAQANSTLASVATDLTQPKVGPADPNLKATLQDIAKGA